MAYPLILSNMSLTVQSFVDRLFLTWYSPEAVGAAVTGFLLAFTIIGLFVGTGEYLTTFVAQYLGARRFHRIGPTIWQGIYFSVGAGICVAAFLPLLRPVFALAGHAPLVQSYEVTYSRILVLGAFPAVLMATLSTFFAGRGETLTVLAVNVVATAANATLDYLWIFGHGGFSRSGVAGAALATVTSQGLGAALFLALILRPRFRSAYRTLSGWRFEPELFRRLLRYGLPIGIQYMVEMLAFALFMMIVGRIGTAELAASSVSFNLNMIVFIPMLGLGVAVSSLVGRHLGANRPDLAERSVWSAFRVSMGYMSVCGAAYVLFPRVLLSPYAAGADPTRFVSIEATATILLRFVALYSVFDMMNIVFASGLRGAGDTVYPLALSGTLAFVAMLGPAYLACVLGGGGIYAAWTAATAYIVLLGALLMRRFRQGRWKSLRVIEHGVPEMEAMTVPVDPSPS